jgi:hypothetical protein
MGGPGGGGDANVTKAVEDLIVVINKNNEVTSDQNDKMVKYTKQLVWLTYVIGFLGIVQLIAVFVQICRR